MVTRCRLGLCAKRFGRARGTFRPCAFRIGIGVMRGHVEVEDRRRRRGSGHRRRHRRGTRQRQRFFRIGHRSEGNDGLIVVDRNHQVDHGLVVAGGHRELTNVHRGAIGTLRLGLLAKKQLVGNAPHDGVRIVVHVDHVVAGETLFENLDARAAWRCRGQRWHDVAQANEQLLGGSHGGKIRVGAQGRSREFLELRFNGVRRRDHRGHLRERRVAPHRQAHAERFGAPGLVGKNDERRSLRDGRGHERASFTLTNDVATEASKRELKGTGER